MQQRYLDTQIESGQAFSPGGCESYADWLANGPIYHYSWERDANDRSTQIQIQADFGTVADTNLFIVALSLSRLVLKTASSLRLNL
jgi:hypothetical protein